MNSLAIIGAGAIGSAVSTEVVAGRIQRLELLGVLTRTNGAALPRDVTRFNNIAALLARSPTLVVEAASHEAVRAHGALVLETGATLICTSVGALADLRLLTQLQRIAIKRGGRLVIPCGAVGALDILRASAVAGLDTVEVVQRKPAKTLLLPEDVERLAAPVTVFSGAVGDAVRMYPKSTNVLAAVALAGIGMERTQVTIVADPAIQGNQAVLRATGAFGSFEFSISNRPSANPRTSAVTACSVISTLHNLSGAMTVPG